MNERHSRDPEDRLRDALSAFTEQVEPKGDAWAKIRAGVDARERRRRVKLWSSVAVAGAAAATLAGVIGVAALRGGPATQVTPDVANPLDELTSGFVAITADGEVRAYSGTGEDRGLVADTGNPAPSGAPASDVEPSQVAVAPDGTVYFTRPTQDDFVGTCPRFEAVGFEIVSVSPSGGEREVVVQVGAYPEVSPDGSQLAYFTTSDGEQCGARENGAVGILDLDDGTSRTLDVTYPAPFDDPSFPPRVAELPLSWSPDGAEIAFNVLTGDSEGWSIVVVDADGGEARIAYNWGEGSGGPANTFVFESTLAVDATIGGGSPDPQSWVGVVDTAAVGSDPLDATSSQYQGVPDGREILALTSDEQTGLVVLAGPRDGRMVGDALLYAEGQESTIRLLASDVVDFAWLPGTTYDDVVNAPPLIEPEEPVEDASAAYTQDDTVPADHPESRDSIGPLTYDDELSSIIEQFGQPTDEFADGVGMYEHTAHFWYAGPHFLRVETYDPATTAGAIEITVPQPGPGGWAMADGVVLGDSTFGEILSQWGDSISFQATPDESYVELKYDACAADGTALLVTFSTAVETTAAPSMSVAGDESTLARVADRARVAFADENSCVE